MVQRPSVSQWMVAHKIWSREEEEEMGSQGQALVNGLSARDWREAVRRIRRNTTGKDPGFNWPWRELWSAGYTPEDGAQQIEGDE